MAQNTCNILVVGQSGSGKSTVANTILGKKCFEVSSSGDGKYFRPEIDEAQFDDVRLKVMDGPNVGTITRTRQEQEAAVTSLQQDIQKVGQSSPDGIHVLVYVLKFGKRFTEEQEEALQILERCFGEKSISSRCIIIFSHGDVFHQAMEDEGTPRKTIKEWCAEQTKLSEFLTVCGERYVLFQDRQFQGNAQVEQRKVFIDVALSIARNQDAIKIVQSSVAPQFGNQGTASAATKGSPSRILITGQKGADMISVANTILGDAFQFPSEVCNPLSFEVNLESPLLTLRVINGFYLKDREATEVSHFLRIFYEGFVLVYVHESENHLTKEDKEELEFLKRSLGNTTFSEKCIIVSTDSSHFQKPLMGQASSSHDGSFTKFIQECNGRYVLCSKDQSQPNTEMFDQLQKLGAYTRPPPRSSAGPLNTISGKTNHPYTGGLNLATPEQEEVHVIKFNRPVREITVSGKY